MSLKIYEYESELQNLKKMVDIHISLKPDYNTNIKKLSDEDLIRYSRNLNGLQSIIIRIKLENWPQRYKLKALDILNKLACSLYICGHPECNQ